MSRAPVVAQLKALPADLDPLLPRLADVLDPVEVARRFERSWPGPPDPGAISGCSLGNTRWTPGVECVATYQIDLAPTETGPSFTIGVVAIDPDGVRHRIFTADPDLPGLAFAADPEVMRRWFSERLGDQLESCLITPIRYRPGQRCVLRYHLSGARETVVYGKILAGHRGADLTSTIGSLGDRLAAPLVGFSREWQLLAQADGGDRSLSSVAYGQPSADGLAEIYWGGRLLANLHSQAGPPGWHRSMVKDAYDLKQYIAAAERAAPATTERFVEGIQHIRVGADPDGPTSPSHGAFRLDQVHLSARGPVLIDLDSYCWSDPARDVGNLYAYLTWREIRQPDSKPWLAEVRRAFLAGYASAMVGPLDLIRLQAFEAASLLKIAGRCYRKLAVEEWDLVPELVDAARDCLGMGAAAAP
jgi:hypothetical protein